MLNKIVLGILLLAASVGALATPQIQHWRMDNGARVYFVENHN